MKHFIFICSLFLGSNLVSQNPCSFVLKKDTCVLKTIQLKEQVELMEVKIKNNYQIQFIKQGTKNYLKLIIKDDLGFGKKGSLLLPSSKKQIYIKSITLQPIDKKSGYFIIDLNETYYLE